MESDCAQRVEAQQLILRVGGAFFACVRLLRTRGRGFQDRQSVFIDGDADVQHPLELVARVFEVDRLIGVLVPFALT